MSRTGINHVNKQCHLGLAKKTSLLHSLKNPLIYECRKNKAAFNSYSKHWKYAESGVNEDE